MGWYTAGCTELVWGGAIVVVGGLVWSVVGRAAARLPGTRTREIRVADNASAGSQRLGVSRESRRELAICRFLCFMDLLSWCGGGIVEAGGLGGGHGCLLSEAASRESRRVRAGRHARFALPVDDQLGSRGFMNLLSWCGGGYRGGWCFGVGAVGWGDGGRHNVRDSHSGGGGWRTMSLRWGGAWVRQGILLT